MCRGCEAHKLTISILQTQLDRLEAHNKDLTARLDILLGISKSNPVVTLTELPKEYSHTKGVQTWSDVRTRLEAADMKRLKELERMEEA